jgi:uracil phosphoribosyltransferase
VGVYRAEVVHRPVDYYERLPPGLADAHVFVVDPMLATGGSAVHALDKLKQAGARRLSLVCLVVAPEGVEAVEQAHPDVQIWTAAIDRELDENAYIRPGLGQVTNPQPAYEKGQTPLAGEPSTSLGKGSDPFQTLSRRAPIS